MNDAAWQELIAEFRELGGTAENICLREGPYGRGLFPIDTAKPVTIRVPETLLAQSDWAQFHGGAFRLTQEAEIGLRERAFLEDYQNKLSWGAGGRRDTERTLEQAQQISPELRKALRSEFHCGLWFADPTDRLVQELFVGSRPIGYKGHTVFMPFIELANHGAGPPIVTNDGVGLHGLFPGEVLVRYAEFDPHGVFVIWGFAADQSQAFSIALQGKVGGRPVQIGRDLGALDPSKEVWFPRFDQTETGAKLEFLMIGNNRHPRGSRSIFHTLMRDRGLSGFETAFETIQHTNRLHFLKLLSAVEEVEGAMALTLRRMARFQLQAMSYCYGGVS
jgi:hypothetical protein